MANAPTARICAQEHVTRDYLRALPLPCSIGPRHMPVPHIDLVEGIDTCLANRGLEIASEDLGVAGNVTRPDGRVELPGRKTLRRAWVRKAWGGFNSGRQPFARGAEPLLSCGQPCELALYLGSRPAYTPLEGRCCWQGELMPSIVVGAHSESQIQQDRTPGSRAV